MKKKTVFFLSILFLALLNSCSTKELNIDSSSMIDSYSNVSSDVSSTFETNRIIDFPKNELLDLIPEVKKSSVMKETSDDGNFQYNIYPSELNTLIQSLTENEFEQLLDMRNFAKLGENYLFFTSENSEDFSSLYLLLENGEILTILETDSNIKGINFVPETREILIGISNDYDSPTYEIPYFKLDLDALKLAFPEKYIKIVSPQDNFFYYGKSFKFNSNNDNDVYNAAGYLYSESKRIGSEMSISLCNNSGYIYYRDPSKTKIYRVDTSGENITLIYTSNSENPIIEFDVKNNLLFMNESKKNSIKYTAVNMDTGECFNLDIPADTSANLHHIVETTENGFFLSWADGLYYMDYKKGLLKIFDNLKNIDILAIVEENIFFNYDGTSDNKKNCIGKINLDGTGLTVLA